MPTVPIKTEVTPERTRNDVMNSTVEHTNSLSKDDQPVTTRVITKTVKEEGIETVTKAVQRSVTSSSPYARIFNDC